MKIVLDRMWPTRVVMGEDPELVSDLALAAMLGQASGEGSGQRVLPVTATRLHARPSEIRWTLERRELQSREFINYSHTAALIRGFLVSTHRGESSESRASAIQLFDPRPGIQNVFIPGMPWNRGVSMKVREGRYCFAPGWVAAMVTPLAEVESSEMLVVEGFSREKSL
jgi:hypothetical protein